VKFLGFSYVSDLSCRCFGDVSTPPSRAFSSDLSTYYRDQSRSVATSISPSHSLPPPPPTFAMIAMIATLATDFAMFSSKSHLLFHHPSPVFSVLRDSVVIYDASPFPLPLSAVPPLVLSTFLSCIKDSSVRSYPMQKSCPPVGP
jgi:hypothetical protein